MALSVSEALYRDNESSVGSHHYPYGKLASIVRDRKASEVGSYGLTRAAEEVEGADVEYWKRSGVVQR